MEAPPSTPSILGEAGTGSATINMDNEAERINQYVRAWKERLGNRRGVLAVRGDPPLGGRLLYR